MSKIDKLVAEIRLAAIEHEHKSLGARLDNRTLHGLDTVVSKSTKKKLKKKSATDYSNNAAPSEAVSTEGGAGKPVGGAAEGVSGAPNPGTKAAAAPAAGAKSETAASQVPDEVSVTSSEAMRHTYSNELQLWRTKSSGPSYTLKRRFYKPELQDSLDNFGEAERQHYRQKSKEGLMNLSSKLRKQFAEVQTDMNYTGVFHPAANAQRVQSMYLTKLYKKINAGNIEDPAIEYIRGEEARRLKEIEDDEARTNALLMKYNQGAGSGPLSTDSQEGQTEEATAPAAAVSTTNAVAEEKVKKEKEEEKNENTDKDNERENEKEKEKEKKSDAGKRRKAPPSEPSSVVGSPTAKGASGRLDLAQSSIGSSTVGGKKKEEEPYLDKLKVKRVKIGTSNPQDILESETRRLAEGSTMVPTREKELSDMLNDETTAWMTSSLHKTVIQKSGRGASLPEILKGPIQPGSIDIVGFDEFMSLLNAHHGDDDEESKRAGSLDPPEAIPGDRKPGHPAAAGLAVVTNTMVEKPAVTNIVKQLADEDEGFKAFLKISQQRPTAKIITKQVSRLTENMTKRSRKLSPIGLEAVLSVNTHKSTKNLFIPAIEEEDSAQDGLGGTDTVEGEGNTGATSGPGVIQSMDSGGIGVNGTGGGFNGKLATEFSPESSNAPSVAGDIPERGEGGHDYDADLIYQKKLDDIWGILRVPAMKRLEFMSKYCQEDFSKSFPVAIERWAELAVLTHGYMETMKVWNMNRRGQIVFPVNLMKIQNVVSSRNFSNLFSHADSLPSRARRFVVDQLEIGFGVHSSSEIQDAGQLKAAVLIALTAVTDRIAERVEALSTDLDDTVYIGSTKLTEYIKTGLKSTVDKEGGDENAKEKSKKK